MEYLEKNFKRIEQVADGRWKESLVRLRETEFTMKRWYSLFPRFITTWGMRKIKLPKNWYSEYVWDSQNSICLHEAAHLKQREKYVKAAPTKIIGEYTFNMQYIQAKSRLAFELEAHREEIRWWARLGKLRQTSDGELDFWSRRYLARMSENILGNYKLKRITTANKIYSTLKAYFNAAIIEGFLPDV